MNQTVTEHADEISLDEFFKKFVCRSVDMKCVLNKFKLIYNNCYGYIIWLSVDFHLFILILICY